MMEWIDFSEEQPELGQTVLAYSQPFERYGIGKILGEEGSLFRLYPYDGDEICHMSVTHWSSLLEPPERKAQSFQVFDVDALKALIREIIQEMAEGGEFKLSVPVYI